MTKNIEIGQKIIVLGCPGSGKSTLAKELRNITKLPLYHLDNIWWKEDRTHVSRDKFDQKLQEIISKDQWIIDGDYSRTYEVRIKACDTIIFLDYPIEVCMQSILERVGTKREDIPWVEIELDPYLVQSVEKYSEENRPKLMELFQKYKDKNISVFKNREEANKALKDKKHF